MNDRMPGEGIQPSVEEFLSMQQRASGAATHQAGLGWQPSQRKATPSEVHLNTVLEGLRLACRRIDIEVYWGRAQITDTTLLQQLINHGVDLAGFKGGETESAQTVCDRITSADAKLLPTADSLSRAGELACCKGEDFWYLNDLPPANVASKVTSIDAAKRAEQVRAEQFAFEEAARKPRHVAFSNNFREQLSMFLSEVPKRRKMFWQRENSWDLVVDRGDGDSRRVTVLVSVDRNGKLGGRSVAGSTHWIVTNADIASDEELRERGSALEELAIGTMGRILSAHK